jgi:hypothetical protein
VEVGSGPQFFWNLVFFLENLNRSSDLVCYDCFHNRQKLKEGDHLMDSVLLKLPEGFFLNLNPGKPSCFQFELKTGSFLWLAMLSVYEFFLDLRKKPNFLPAPNSIGVFENAPENACSSKNPRYLKITHEIKIFLMLIPN